MTGDRSRTTRRAFLLVAAFVLAVAGAAPAAAATSEWHIDRIGAPMSAAGITVAVVDTGVDGTHPAFGRRVLPQIDLVTEEPSNGDPNGHGTHVAGTVAAAAIECGGSAVNLGVAPDVRILPVRVLDSSGSGSTRTVAQGIRAAADAGAHVINLSLGSDVVIRKVAGSGLEEAIDYAWAKGSVVTLAAGNDVIVGALLGSGYGGIPAMVVTATTHEDRIAPYATSIGSADWGISAPGGDGSKQRGRDVLSVLPGSQCGLKAGTSMATPHVSGAVAVLRARGFGPRPAVDRLLETAKPLGSYNTYGAGLVDLRAATATPAPPPTAAPTTAPPPPPPPETTEAPTTTAKPSEDPSPATTGARAPTTAAPTTATDAPVPPLLDAETTTTTDGSFGDELFDDVVDDDVEDPDDERDEETAASGDLQVTEDDDGTPGALIAAAVGGIVAVGAFGARMILVSRRGL